MLKVIDREGFKLALRSAKWIAQKEGLSILTPSLMLDGFIWISDSSELGSELLPEVCQKLSRLKSRFDIEPIPTDFLEKVLSLSPELKSLLAENKTDLDQFVLALIGSKEPVLLEQSLVFSSSLSLARIYAKQFELSSVSLELLTAAIYWDYINGRYRSENATLFQIAANQRFFQATYLQLQRDHKGHFEPLRPADPPNYDEVGLDDNLAEALKLARSSSEPVVTLLAHCISIGHNIVLLHRVAIHEAGHAVASFLLRPQLPVLRASIVGTKDSNGYVAYDAHSPYWSLVSKANVSHRISVALAGRVAEKLEYGSDEMDTGAQSDIESATDLAWRAVTEWGLHSRFGPVSVKRLREVGVTQPSWLEAQAQEYLQEMLIDCEAEVTHLLKENWTKVKGVSAALLEKKELDLEDLLFSMLDRSLVNWPGVVKVASKETVREVTFAATAGIVKTLEGDVSYKEGDAIVTGVNKDQWPVDRLRFFASHEAEGTTVMGSPGKYRKKSAEFLAFKVSRERELVLSDGRGTLHANADDWLMDYGEGDLAVVNARLFDEYYEVRE